jgi:hypothetical protein
VIVCVCVCVCSLSYPACNAHVPYCLLWPALLYNIFPHLINCTIFEKKLLNTKCVFRFPLQLLFEPSLVLRRTERDMIKKKCVVVYCTRFSCLILMKLEFCRQFFEKYSISDFIKVLSVRAELFHANRRTEIHANLIVAFRNFANAPKNEFLHNS